MYLCGIGLPWAYWSSYFSFPQNLPDGTNFLYQPITWAQSVYKRRWKSLMRSKDLGAESGIFEKIYLPTIYCTCAKEGYIYDLNIINYEPMVLPTFIRETMVQYCVQKVGLSTYILKYVFKVGLKMPFPIRPMLNFV